VGRFQAHIKVVIYYSPLKRGFSMRKGNMSAPLKSSSLSQSVAALGIVSTLAIAVFAMLPTSKAQAQTATPTVATDSVRTDSMMAHRGGANASDRSEKYTERRTDRMFDRIKATPEQREKIRSFMSNSKVDMRAQQQARMDNQKAMSAALAAPTIDRIAIEKLRSAQLAQVETQSKKRTDIMIAIAEVLSPEQRQEMAKMMTRGDKRGHRGPGHGGHGQRVGMAEDDGELMVATIEQN
jgi:Spy/CpxP family protein refolding chaperone